MTALLRSAAVNKKNYARHKTLRIPENSKAPVIL